MTARLPQPMLRGALRSVAQQVAGTLVQQVQHGRRLAGLRSSYERRVARLVATMDKIN